MLNFFYWGACKDFFAQWLLLLRPVLFNKYQISLHVSLKSNISLYQANAKRTKDDIQVFFHTNKQS